MFGVLLRFRIWLRAVCWVGCFAALGVTIAYWARGQEGRSASEQQQRLERLERAAEELLNQVRALRQEQSQPPPSTSTSGQEPGRRSRTEPLPPVVLPDSWLKWIQWRSIGPANMGGRIVDLAVCESDPSTFWVATASGGLLKTTNNGITFEHQFDHEATVSIGAVAVAPSDPNIVWVGTGENNPRNSVSYGDGVYKSTDGGKTWKKRDFAKRFRSAGS